ncbi:MATE family efflux transporter [Alkalibaculum sporogenes]|nr:MATE family efflux transporter [Alkalibaculum sporogenes]
MDRSKSILKLALPLMISNLLQQMYNMVDAIIVGRYVNAHALAAVGTSGYIILILTYFFIGLSVGASIVAAQAYGAGRKEELNRTVHTTIGFSLISGVFLTIIGIMLSPIFLEWMNVPKEVMPYALTYLRFYFYSMIPMLIYNMGSGLMRALGNTKVTLYCLAASGILNILLSIIFVKVLSMGVAGAALATILAQILSAVMIIYILMNIEPSYRLSLRKIRICRKELKMIIRIGAPTGLQSVVQSFSNTFIQAKLNLFGADFMAGITASVKIEGLIYMPIEGFAMAGSTLAGQSTGAGDKDSVKDISHKTLWMTSMVTILICSILFIFAPKWIGIFAQEERVINYGTDMMRFIVPLYFIYGINQVVGGIIRGCGQAKIPMTITLICYCGFRILWSSLILNFINEPWGIYLCYPLSWIFAVIAYSVYYKKGNWLTTMIIKERVDIDEY